MSVRIVFTLELYAPDGKRHPAQAWSPQPETPPPWILFIHGFHYNAQARSEMGFDIGDADVEAFCDLGIAHLIHPDRQKHLAVHAVHPIDDALGAPQAQPFLARHAGAHCRSEDHTSELQSQLSIS